VEGKDAAYEREGRDLVGGGGGYSTDDSADPSAKDGIWPRTNLAEESRGGQRNA
jgi:hypothetical protein